jgi:site-specific DNA recombinase
MRGDERASEGVSLAAQRARIEAYCVAKDWELLAVEADLMSAKDCKRLGLQAVLEAVGSRRVAAIVVYKLDRLARSVLDLNRIVELLDKNGVSLVSMQESLGATTPTGRLMLILLASVSQWEREVICQRTKEAMSYLKEQNKVIAKVHSRPVYGYNNVDGRLYENEYEQAVIERIKGLREDENPYRTIAAQLNDEGVPTKRGGSWHNTTVRLVLLRA